MRLALALFLAAFPLIASGAGEKPLFREDWKETPPAIPVTQEHVANADLIVSRHGPGASVIKKSHHDWVEGDPYYVWSGLCDGTWAVSLEPRDGPLDLSQGGRIRWRAKQSGFRHLRVILRLEGGQWLVSDAADGASADWRVREFVLADIRWRKLDIDRVVEGDWAQAPDLSRVSAVGFTDLMTGGRSQACSRLDWIEVYGSAAGG